MLHLGTGAQHGIGTAFWRDGIYGSFSTFTAKLSAVQLAKGIDQQNTTDDINTSGGIGGFTRYENMFWLYQISVSG